MTAHHKPLYRGKGAPRKILSRSADTVVVMDDYGGGPPTKATVRLAGADRIAYEFDSKMYHSTGTMAFIPEGAGTRMRLESTPGWKGFGKLVGLLWGKRFVKLVTDDQDAHLREMEDEWKAKPW